MTRLSLRGITKRYGALEVIHGIDLDVPAGEFVVFVGPSGCGKSMTESRPGDEAVPTPGGTLFIDGGSLMYLIGSIMDWKEDDFAAGFVFENPNSKGSCGCGESFTV